jgi:hypothetical protein
VIVDIGTGIEQGFIKFEDYGTDTFDDHIPGSSDSDLVDGDSDFESEDEEANEISSIEAELFHLKMLSLLMYIIKICKPFCEIY